MASEMPAAPWARGLEHEFDLVRSAIALVAAGGARRLTLVGLPLDAPARRDVERLVRASGMVLRVTVSGRGCDLTLEASA